jgi:hypothetical protein
MLEESAVEDGDAPATSPVSPLARRMSFGARALRDARTGAAGATNSMCHVPPFPFLTLVFTSLSLCSLLFAQSSPVNFTNFCLQTV